MKNILLIGLGAIGSLVASKFADSDVEIDILLDEDRYKAYSKSPIIINGREYNFSYVTQKKCIKKYDFVIVATKHYSLKSAIEELDSLLCDNCTIMSLLNGIDSEEVIGDRYGVDKCIYAFITNTDATRVNRTVTFNADGKIFFGEKDGSASQRTEDIAALFDKINMDYKLTDDIITKQWKKFMINIGLNQVSAVLRASYGYFIEIDEILKLTKAAMKEVVDVAKAMEIDLKDSDIDRSLKYISTLSPQGKTSMLQDIEAKRKTEVEMLAKTLIELGKKYNVETPINNVLFLQIKSLESMY